ncbi:MAG: dihydroorotase [Haloferacaceae archaeon]
MLVRDATLAGGDRRDVRTGEGRVAAVGTDLAPAEGERVVDAGGALLLPGAVDVHVHFREPGDPHKETWTTGSRAAAAGGVTTVVDQPNTDPPTTTGPAFDVKARHARASLVDYGLNGGVVPDWDPDALFDRPLFALGEVFLADSTGDMGIDADLFRAAAERAAAAGVTVTVHAEDAALFDESARERSDADAWSAYRPAEAEVAAVERALEVAADAGADLHVAHTSTPEAADLVADAPGATCEATPHHLLLSREDLPDLGTFGRMNPPLRSEARRRGLYERVADGTVDIVATDHAPHTRAEKDAPVWAAPSGVPGVGTMVPLLLARARDPDDPLTVERLRAAVAGRPADRFDLRDKGRIEPGADADLALYPDGRRPVGAGDRHSKCGWTPFEDRPGCFPALTVRRGEPIYDPGGRVQEGGRAAPFGSPSGRNVRAE